MQTTPQIALAYWPVLATAGAGLVAWGYQRASHEALKKEVDTKASKDKVDEMSERVASIDEKLDILIKRGVA